MHWHLPIHTIQISKDRDPITSGATHHLERRFGVSIVVTPKCSRIRGIVGSIAVGRHVGTFNAKAPSESEIRKKLSQMRKDNPALKGKRLGYVCESYHIPESENRVYYVYVPISRTSVFQRFKKD
jgi:hypothetical protein